MNLKRILITGGAGFVGSSLALRLREAFSTAEVVCLDNLYRKGSELNRQRLEEAGASFIRADVRDRASFEIPRCDLIIDAAAEPSVLAGSSGDAAYVVDTNLGGTLNLLEAARTWDAAVLFLSTSRVYPVEALRAISLVEGDERFEIGSHQQLPGVSENGISEQFPLENRGGGDSSRTLYGATKYASEVMLREYVAHFGLRALIDRCGVIAGPWQMGRVDQGIVALWVAAHVYGTPLSYIGYGGKQVRDVLHVQDLGDLIAAQLNSIDSWNGGIYNVGGGRAVSFSLRELTGLVSRATGQRIEIGLVEEVRPGDVALYLTDATEVCRGFDWTSVRTAADIVEDTARWITDNQDSLHAVFC